MLNKIKRLSAAFLALVIIVGSLGLTSAEAALAKPQNIRFVQWNKLDYSSATIAWNRVSGANWYYVRCCWTAGQRNLHRIQRKAELRSVVQRSLSHPLAQVRKLYTDKGHDCKTPVECHLRLQRI